MEFCDEANTSIKAGSDQRSITDDERNILRATALLYLYNLVEAVCTQMIKDLCQVIEVDKLSHKNAIAPVQNTWLLNEWKDRREVGSEKAVQIIQNLIEQATRNKAIRLDAKQIKGSLEGNADLSVIRKIASSFGFEVLPQNYPNEGADLQTIKLQRNKLAHGEVSFSNCGRDYPPPHLKTFRDNVINTLDGVLSLAEAYITNTKYKR